MNMLIIAGLFSTTSSVYKADEITFQISFHNHLCLTTTITHVFQYLSDL